MENFITPNRFYAILLVTVQLLLGCQDKEEPRPEPAPSPGMKLGKVIHSGGASREFSYHSNGQLQQIHGKGMYALSGNSGSHSSVLYNAFGKIKEMITTGDSFTYKTVYSYNSSRQLVRTEEYINSQLQYYFTYEYNARGRLITKYSFEPQTPESSTFKAAIKQEYTYDQKNNLSQLSEFSKITGSNNWSIYLTYQYRDYDDRHSVNHLLGYPHLLPDVILQNNNSGKIIRINYPGGATSITTQTYEYNSYNYPIKKITTSSNNTSSQTTFSYSQ